MMLKSTLSFLGAVLFYINGFAQITLATAAPNNGSGGIFLRLTTNTNSITVQKFNTYFSNSAAVSIEIYTRSGDYTAFTTSNAGWTFVGTATATGAGTTTLAPVDVTSFNLTLAASSVTSIYLQSVTTGGGIRYTGTTAIPPTTTWTDANVELFSNIARTTAIPFGGSQNSPRVFAGSVEYVLASTPTPVKWLGISARKMNTGAEVSWTVEEQNVRSYQVLKQTDTGYLNLATMASKGDGQKSYTFTDLTAFSAKEPHVIYRIRQIEKDGTLNYSPFVVVKDANTKPVISCYPNPFTNSVQINTAVKENAFVSDVTGKTIATIQLQIGTNAIDAHAWLPGVSLLKTASGQTAKIIKQ